MGGLIEISSEINGPFHTDVSCKAMDPIFFRMASCIARAYQDTETSSAIEPMNKRYFTEGVITHGNKRDLGQSTKRLVWD